MLTSELSLAPTRRRADALDALRGFAILAMIFSGTIRYKILPTWMYHAQNPPPTHEFNAKIPGLTWVDVVFPLFLFALGAAIPLALSRRLERGESRSKLGIYIFKRGLLLAAFAIVVQHLRPYTINPQPTKATWWIAMVGFGLLFLMFGRWSGVGKLGKFGTLINLAGWAAAIALIAQFQYGGKGFSLDRSDPILMVLANMAVFGALIWLVTRSNLRLRLGLMGILLSVQLSATTSGWVKVVWGSSPVDWLFQFYYLEYLFIVIPGMIVGDLILSHLRQTSDIEASAPNRSRLLAIGAALLLICLVLLVGLQARWIWQTTLLSAALCSATWMLVARLRPDRPNEHLLRQIYQWGVYWLFLGLCFEPFQGGIHKDPATYSYFFVTSGMACFLLMVFTIAIDELQLRRELQLLIDNGQNPMIAYVAFANLLWPILQLSGLEDWVIAHTGTPLLGVVKGVGYTLPIALLTSFLTRKKLFWRV